MTKNELIVGEPRLGWFIDGNEDTDSISVMLRDTGTTIELSVPLQGMFGPNDPYDRWWSQGAVFDDDPDRSKHTYNPQTYYSCTTTPEMSHLSAAEPAGQTITSASARAGSSLTTRSSAGDL